MTQNIINQLSRETRDNLNQAICKAMNELTTEKDKKLTDLFLESPEGLESFWNLYAMSERQFWADQREDMKKAMK